MSLSKQNIIAITAALEAAIRDADPLEQERYEAALAALKKPAGVDRTTLGLRNFLIMDERQVQKAVASLEQYIKTGEADLLNPAYQAATSFTVEEQGQEIAMAQSVLAALQASGSMLDFLGSLTHDEMVLLKDLL